MPKQRITKEMVVDAAFEIARKDGIEKATVKTIAEKLDREIYVYRPSEWLGGFSIFGTDTDTGNTVYG